MHEGGTKETTRSRRGANRRLLWRALLAFTFVVPILLSLDAATGVAFASVKAAAGAAEITQAGLTTPLTSGGSAAQFGVVLPSGARCPGDTAKDGYHVFSYLVPKGVSPTDVSFKGIFPSEYFGYTALDEYYYGAENTAPHTGLILDLPAFFVFSRLTTQELFGSGVTKATWEGGIACTNSDGQVTNFWNTQFVFSASSSDPGGFTWAVVDPARIPGAGAGRGFPTWLALVLAGGALVAAGGVFKAGQRRGERAKATKEGGGS